jgi:hypothetical protein
MSAPNIETPASLLRSVNTSDGVSREEAEYIAKAYFWQHIVCGVYGGISDENDYWVVEGAFGVAALPIKGFTISKSSGAISSPVGPSYAHPSDILK